MLLFHKYNPDELYSNLTSCIGYVFFISLRVEKYVITAYYRACALSSYINLKEICLCRGQMAHNLEIGEKLFSLP